MQTLCFTCVISLLKNVPATRWKKFCLGSALLLDRLCSACPDTCHAVFQRKTVRYACSPDCCAFKSVLRRPCLWLETHCQQTRRRHCHPARSTAETFKLNPFQQCYAPICLPKGTAKEQGHGRKSYKVFSLNPLYQIEEDVGRISFNKSWGTNMLVFYV